MAERGAPAGGDLLVEAAKCSLQSVKGVMSMGIAATATSGEGRTALTKARDLDLLEFLVAQGVKVDARDNQGRTALMFHRTAEVTRFLLAHGADPRAKDNEERTALHYNGSRDQLFDIFSMLLEAGADPNARSHGDTPLLGHRFYVEIDELLISHGGDWRNDGHTSVLNYLVEDNYFPVEALKWPGLDLGGADGANLLLAALGAQKFEVLQKLLDLGANPTVWDPTLSVGDRYFQESAFEAVTRKGMTDENPLYRSMRQAAERFWAAQRAAGDAGSPDAGADDSGSSHAE